MCRVSISWWTILPVSACPLKQYVRRKGGNSKVINHSFCIAQTCVSWEEHHPHGVFCTDRTDQHLPKFSQGEDTILVSSWSSSQRCVRANVGLATLGSSSKCLVPSRGQTRIQARQRLQWYVLGQCGQTFSLVFGLESFIFHLNLTSWMAIKRNFLYKCLERDSTNAGMKKSLEKCGIEPYSTKSPSQSEALCFTDSAKSPYT